jgi:hypothetical protein
MSESSSTPSVSNERLPAAMQNEIVQKLVWSGLVATIGAITAIVARKIAEQIWVRVFNEPPPID